jgi:hypothetical protein
MTRQACALTAIALSLLGVTNVSQAQQPALESFYVGRFFFSDDVSYWNHQVLEVSPAGDDVRVRLIRLSLANPQCDGVLVQAAERVVPRTTARKLAGVDVCALDSTGVESALERAAAHGQITEAASTTVVATCAGQQRVLRFPYGPSINWKSLERSSPQVAKAAKLFYEVRDRAFGRDLSFDSSASDAAHGREALGTALVPELLTGKFNTVLGASIVDRLEGYKGPPSQTVLPADLLEREQLKFETYVPVSVPPIAMAARVFGDVRLALTLDRITGAVTEVQAVSGPALLSKHAATTVRGWRFVPASLAGDRLEITLRFQPRCG